MHICDLVLYSFFLFKSSYCRVASFLLIIVRDVNFVLFLSFRVCVPNVLVVEYRIYSSIDLISSPSLFLASVFCFHLGINCISHCWTVLCSFMVIFSTKDPWFPSYEPKFKPLLEWFAI